MSMKKAVVSAVCVAFAVGGCATGGRGPMTETQKGAVIGAVGGGILGSAIGKKRGKGALIGAVGGGLAGAAVGNYMDRQKQDLERNLRAEREAGAIDVEKLPGDIIKVTMTSQTAFDSDSTMLKQGFVPTMDKLANVVTQYNKTALTVVGHTDSEGSDQYNQQLSERRAAAVTNYLQSKNVAPERLAAVGKGELSPIAENRTEAGRRANRRVEVFVEPVRAE